MRDTRFARDVEMCESLSGYWFYHLRDPGAKVALCGSPHIMDTHSPVGTWGFRGHLGERYCLICERKAGLQREAGS